MKFKIDENLPVEVAELLRQTGYDAATVLEQDLGGSADTDISSLCQDKPYVLQIFSRLIRIFSTEPLERRLWIVEEDRIRIRA